MQLPPANPEQEARGFLAELHFFKLASAMRRKPRGMVRVEQASSLLDARGIDGFVFHYRCTSQSDVRRIPIQLKTGSRHDHYFVAGNGLHVPIVPINLGITEHQVFHHIRRLLDYYEMSPVEYEPKLLDLEMREPRTSEARYVTLIDACREKYSAPGGAPAFA